MSWCAGFSPAFWSGYHSVIPRAPGAARKDAGTDMWTGLMMGQIMGQVSQNNTLTIGVLDAGFEDRHKIYTLYHYLNHYNLFGGGYLRQAESLLSQLTSICKESL